MHHKYQWIAAALLLPAMIFRALIPVGFMPMAGAGGAMELALCPGTVDGATFIAAAIDPHAKHHHEHHDQRSPPCAYALSGTAMPAPVIPAQVLFTAMVEPPRARIGTVVFLPAIVRVHLPRGPPASV